MTSLSPNTSSLRGSFKTFIILLAFISGGVHAFVTNPPSTSFFHHYNPHATSKSLTASNEKDASTVEDPLTIFGPLRFIVPGLFVAQICFLAVAKETSGLDNLTLYGELGNVYIRQNGGYDLENKNFLERQQITQRGQKIWLNNVLRDIQNGGPVKPPLSEP
mmetsp:Transcript_23128/g.35037  ORF Transcript_23128/g.35037 Transcript_23128/m.35037 type:complete len:162 (+) Transcript_23128:181-666(+)|eukprot:CAMPEP_0178907564 /NCGR_PEP_ID=MMETSP0786-20121207/7441_1 /TAXON_ID=186022 /ORGANISM="Thalassionema frauenfeldii, Strain CCMP 1798" /LENGTH=161 /DNA_ID=CAMNT_0020579377 /DNA_START=136 /DNA_END=621 /DNA_ORIENTATION=+